MPATSSALSRIVGVEEHVAFLEMLSQLSETEVVKKGYVSREHQFGPASQIDRLSDTEGRLPALAAGGLTVQVLSYPMAGGDVLPPREARGWVRTLNNKIRQRIAAHPDRYAGLAHLPMVDPEAAADELEMAVVELGFKGALVNGATAGRYLDHPSFEPILACAERLDVPIFLHPAPSPEPVREALYAGLPKGFSFFMSSSGWGWHADTATHVLRLMLSGAFQRHPCLKLMIGHNGEGLQVMMSRLDQQFHTFAGFDDIPSALLRKHVWVGMGGFFYEESFMAALDAFGADRMLYSTDYPWGSHDAGRAFLERLPIDDQTRAKIAHGNADDLLKLCSSRAGGDAADREH